MKFSFGSTAVRLRARAGRLVMVGLIAGATNASVAADAASEALDEVTVTASRVNLLGTAITASQGSVTEQELDLRPAYRVGQLLESVPGLVVTVHSGEGKANQYLARRFQPGPWHRYRQLRGRHAGEPPDQLMVMATPI